MSFPLVGAVQAVQRQFGRLRLGAEKLLGLLVHAVLNHHVAQILASKQLDINIGVQLGHAPQFGVLLSHQLGRSVVSST